MMPSENPLAVLYRASIRHPLRPDKIVEYPDGLLAITDRGKIAACGPFEKLRAQVPKDCAVQDYRGSWILPGFVDCHSHLPQLDCRNKGGLTLLDWLKTHIYPAEAKFADPKVARETFPRFFDELLANGITTAALFSTVHFEATDIAFQIAREKGIRAIIGEVLMDQNSPSILQRPKNQLLRESEKLISKWDKTEGRLFYALTPRFALTCSKELLKEAGKMALEAKVYFQTHLAETKEEIREARSIHSFRNYPEFFEKQGCLGSRSLFAHCIYLEDEEWRLLAEHRSAVASCPTSNLFLKSGTMPLAQVEKHRLRYGFGSDVGAGPTFSMRKITDVALKVHPASFMSEEKAFYLATLGGAESLSLGDQIGNFIEGKWADFLICGDRDYQGEIREVFVAGRRVFKAS